PARTSRTSRRDVVTRSLRVAPSGRSASIVRGAGSASRARTRRSLVRAWSSGLSTGSTVLVAASDDAAGATGSGWVVVLVTGGSWSLRRGGGPPCDGCSAALTGLLPPVVPERPVSRRRARTRSASKALCWLRVVICGQADARTAPPGACVKRQYH